jgi:hypothetical protein
MKSAVLLLAVAGAAFGQFTSPTGFGRQIYPGTGGPTAPPRGYYGPFPWGAGLVPGYSPPFYPGAGVPPVKPIRPGGGFRPGGRYPFGPFGGYDRYPYDRFDYGAYGLGGFGAFPIFYGGYGLGGYGYENCCATPAVSAGYELNYQPQDRSPVVIINQGYNPETLNREPEAEPPPPPAARSPRNRAAPQTVPESEQKPAGKLDENNLDPTIYLIAMKDNSIFAAVGYWVEGDTLVYITRDGSRNRASLSLVDRELSQKLNDQRHVDFKLPKR